MATSTDSHESMTWRTKITHEHTVGMSVEELSQALLALNHNAEVVTQRRKSLQQQRDHQPTIDRSAVIENDVILTKLANTLPANSIHRFAFEFLVLTPLEISNASGMLKTTVYERVSKGLYWWTKQNSRHNTGRLRQKLTEAVESGFVEKEILNVLRTCNDADALSNQQLSQVALCFTTSSWTPFSCSYLKIPRSFSAFERAEEDAFLQKQALGVLQIWRNKAPAKTHQDLLDVLDRAHSEGVLPRQSIQVVDAGYDASVTTVAESVSLYGVMMDKSGSSLSTIAESMTTGTVSSTPGDENLELPYESLNDKISRLSVDYASLQIADIDLATIRRDFGQLFIYNRSMNRWMHNQDIPKWCDDDTSYCEVGVTLNRGVVAVGGYNRVDYMPDVTVMDVERRVCLQLPDLPRGVCEAGVHCTKQDQLYVIGGHKTKSAYKIDVHLSSKDGLGDIQWYQLPDLKLKAVQPLVLSDATQVYVLGGYGNASLATSPPPYSSSATWVNPFGASSSLREGNSSRSVQIYDIRRSTWSEAPSLREGCNAVDHGAVMDGSDIVVFTNMSVITYDTRTNTHTVTSHGIDNVYRIKPVRHDGGLMVYVWHDMSGNTRALYHYNRRTRTHTKSGINVVGCGATQNIFAL